MEQTYYTFVGNAIRASLPKNQQALQPIRYHYNLENELAKETNSIDGKLFRSSLFFLALYICGKRSLPSLTPYLPIAVALEHLHNFTLMHDDIEDQDTMRRGRKTAWVIFGVAQTINAGDLLRELAMKQLHTLSSKKISAQMQIRILELFNHTTIRLSEGQAMDIHFEGRTDVMLKEYMQMISGKTGAMIELPFSLAALVTHAPSLLSDQLQQFAQALGKLYQLQDDYLGIWGIEEKTGKSVSSDIYKRKNTFPIVCALQKNIPYLKKLYIRDTPPDKNEISYVRNIMETSGAKQKTEEEIQTYKRNALKVIEEMHISPSSKNRCMQLIDFLISRDH